MNLEKAKKRIAKRVRMGMQGYPIITIAYHGVDDDVASEVSITFLLEEGGGAQAEEFSTKGDAREDESVQSAIVKMIERTGAKTVFQENGVTVFKTL